MMRLKLRRTLRPLLVISVVMLTALSSAWAGPPTDFVKSNTKDVNQLLRESESDTRRQKFSKKLNEIVDFRELSSRALGQYWEQRTPEERQQFLDLLQQLLEANYRKKLEGHSMGQDYQIEYVDERTRDKRAIVDTIIKWEGGAKPASYKLLDKKSGGWVVYDIILDDISLVETYRDAYTKIIKQEGWDALIERMKKKAAQLNSGGPDSAVKQPADKQPADTAADGAKK